MSTMAKNDPIPVDDQCPFFRQVVDSSSVLLHTARPDGYLEFFDQTWLDFACMPLENLLGCGWAFLYSSRRCRSPYAEDARVPLSRENPFRKHQECEEPMVSSWISQPTQRSRIRIMTLLARMQTNGGSGLNSSTNQSKGPAYCSKAVLLNSNSTKEGNVVAD
jgi:hypothetical protein